MKLTPNWLTEGLVDYEYKKYMILAYLQKVESSFNRVELYPYLSELIFHYQNMLSIQKNKWLLSQDFPKEIFLEETQKLGSRQTIEDDEVMEELETILRFALPNFKKKVDDGVSIYEFVESSSELLSIGLTPLYKNEGYLCITQPPQVEVSIYRYQTTFFHQEEETFHGIHVQYLYTDQVSLSNTYEHIKMSLVKTFTDLPNPPVYLLRTKIKFPFSSTVMPLAKRALVRLLSKDEKEE